MKRLAMLPFFVVAFMTLCLVFAQRGYAEQPPVLEVIHSAICLEVVEHACVGTNDVFPAKVGKLYCLTRVYGAKEDTEVTHVWFFGDTERARIKLDIRSVNFRTYSSKIIRPHEIGSWRVDILDSENRVLKVVEFSIE